jgi:hypothetical protein
MNLAKLSKRVTQELDDALSDDLPTAEREAILKIVQQGHCLLRPRGRPCTQDSE